jgi:hypothetical protein
VFWARSHKDSSYSEVRNDSLKQQDKFQPTEAYVSPGMPPLDMSGKQTSFFEFWPTWLVYLPVVLQSLLLALINRSLTLPLIANPRLPLSGMVGVEKSRLLSQASGECKQHILDWFVHVKTDASIEDQVSQISAAIASGY